MQIPLDYEMLQAYMLVACRVTLFVAIAPPFSSTAFPWRIKSIVILGLSLAFMQRIDLPAGGLGGGDLITAAISEAATGAALGILVMVAFAAIPTAGSLIDLMGGFSMAQSYDPTSMVNGAQFTRLFSNGMIAIMFAMGAHIPIFMGLSTSFDVVQLGVFPELANAANTASAAFVGMFAAAIQIAGPLMVVLFLADVGLGLLTRVAPTLNAFSLGFPLKILVTLGFAGMVFAALPLAIDQLTDSSLELMREALR